MRYAILSLTENHTQVGQLNQLLFIYRNLEMLQELLGCQQSSVVFF